MQFVHRTYPMTRLRRSRRSAELRSMVQETSLGAQHLIAPLFVLEGINQQQAVAGMPGVIRKSIDLTLEYVKQLVDAGVNMVALFPVVDPSLKSADAKEAYNPKGLMQRAIFQIKAAFPHVVVISDVALDPFTSDGQDGLTNSQGYVVNDPTNKVLVKQALSHASAGADVIAPSDMMDGRVGQIRLALEEHGFHNTLILSYAAKYASSFYGPFREAVGSSASLKGDKRQYQMNPANTLEALQEVAQDLTEGADWVMVKPGMPYLDVCKEVKTAFGVPTFAYQVSGEYAMLKAALEQGWLDSSCVLESLLGFRRAGCDGILTYFALEAATMLKQESL